MARSPRSLVVEPGSAHHVTIRGNDGRRLFSYSSDRLDFLRDLARGLAVTSCPLHAITLMSNHVHLVLTPPTTAALSLCMQLTTQPFSRRHNAARGGRGKLFDERFFALPLRDEAHLAATLAYVDLNPVTAWIVTTPEAFVWSSYRSHAGHPAPHHAIADVWSPHDWYLALGSTAERRAAAYREFVASRREEHLRIVAADVGDDDQPVRRPRNVRLPRVPY